MLNLMMIRPYRGMMMSKREFVISTLAGIILAFLVVIWIAVITGAM